MKDWRWSTRSFTLFPSESTQSSANRQSWTQNAPSGALRPSPAEKSCVLRSEVTLKSSFASRKYFIGRHVTVSSGVSPFFYHTKVAEALKEAAAARVKWWRTVQFAQFYPSLPLLQQRNFNVHEFSQKVGSQIFDPSSLNCYQYSRVLQWHRIVVQCQVQHWILKENINPSTCSDK